MNKNEFTSLVRRLGGDTAYSGNEKTMFVTGLLQRQREFLIDTVKTSFKAKIIFQ